MTDTPEPPLAGTRFLTEQFDLTPVELTRLAPDDSPDLRLAMLAAKAALVMDDAHSDLLDHLQHLRQGFPAADTPLESLSTDMLLNIADRTFGLDTAAAELAAAHRHLTAVVDALRPRINQLIAHHTTATDPAPGRQRFTAARLTMTSATLPPPQDPPRTR